MSKLVIGDKIEVIEHSTDEYIGKRGEVILVTSGIKANSQPIVEKIPELKSEPRYSVILEESRELHNLREQQLSKL